MKNSRAEAQIWNYTCVRRRGYHGLGENLTQFVADMFVKKYMYRRFESKHPGDVLSIDHIINKVGVLDHKQWDRLSIQDKREWIAFIKEWEHVGRTKNGSFWIVSGLHCRANLQIIHKRANSVKGAYFDILGL